MSHASNRPKTAKNPHSPLFVQGFFTFFAISAAFGLIFINFAPALANSEEHQKISASCDSIKQTLKSLQKSDSKTRVYLGTSYERLISSFIIPLNANIVKENKISPTFISLQSEITNKRDSFNKSFIEYSKSLEDLANIDCASQPENFSKSLKSVREKRAEVATLASSINQLLSSYQSEVEKLVPPAPASSSASSSTPSPLSSSPHK